MKYHFIGIGGIGMSALARLLRHDGFVVSGSDRAETHITEDLRRLGASVAIGHAAGHVPADAVVIISDAVHEENPELVIARARGQRILRRSALMGEMMARRTGIAISGTHGKTTTTAMAAHILLANGLDPTVVVGGEALGPEGNAHAGTGDLFVAEACEAYDSFVDLAPKVAVVTNVEPDHLDHHGDFEHIRAAFRRFTGQVAPDGALILNADDPEAAALSAATAARVVTYGLEAGDWRAASIRLEGLGSRFAVLRDGARVAEGTLCVPGLHNVSNALAAILVGVEAGLPPQAAARALASYHGVARRFEPLGIRDGVRVYDDYAHHPTEIRATLAAARTAFEGRLVAVFQPHLYSRTRDFLADFIAAFDDADVVVITDIYQAREEPIPGITAEAIAMGLRARCPNKPVCYVPDKAQVADALGELTRPGDVVLTIGAGDIREAGEAFLSSAMLEVAA